MRPLGATKLCRVELAVQVGYYFLFASGDVICVILENQKGH